MVDSQLSSQYKMAAIDLDGTLLGPDGNISAANRRAVQRLQRAGLEVVLATGRHHATMHHYADTLPGIRWLISCQGGEVSDVRRKVVLNSQFLSRAQVREALQLGRTLGVASVAYGVEGVFTVAEWNPDLNFYSQFASYQPSPCTLNELLNRRIFKVLWMGSPEQIERAKQQAGVDPAFIQMVQTHARFLEFMPVDVSKASALQILARRLGVAAAETIAFGDGDNDVPMFEWAGVSVAMPHGWPAAIRTATHTAAAGSADTALARAVDWLFDQGLLAAAEAPRAVAASAAQVRCP